MSSQPLTAILLSLAFLSLPLSTLGQDAAAPAAEEAEPEIVVPEPPPHSIEIAVDVIEYRLSEEQQFGLLYDYIRKSGDMLDANLFLPGTTGAGDTPLPAMELTFDLLNSHYGDLNVTIQAAIQSGQAQIISNPRTVVLDGNPAHIVSGQSFLITTLKQEGSKQTLGSEQKDTGVKMYVTPTVLMDQYVLMAVRAEVSEIVSLESFSPSDTTEALFELPRLQRRTVQTVVLVPSGETIYIGGLILESESDTIRKVPIAGDLPFVGSIFRSKNDDSFFTETLFQITPTILKRGEGGNLPFSSVGEGLEESLLGGQTVDTATGALELENQLEDEPESPFIYDDAE